MKRVFAFIGFTVAITLIVLNVIDYKYSYIVLGVAVALFIASLLFKVLRKGRVVPVVLGSVIFACCIFSIAYSNTYLPQSQLDGERLNVKMQIISMPEERNSGGYTYTAKVSFVKRENAPQNFKVKLNSDAELGVDSYTDFDGCVQFYSIADNAFESYSYFGDNIFLSANVVSISETYEQEKTLGYYFLQIKESVKKILGFGFDGDTLALATGILLGDKTQISGDMTEGFEICGTSHIIAVSGLHISVICLCLYQVLKLFDCSRGVRTVISLIVLFAYSGVVGFPKSVLRAGIMLGVLLISKLLSAKADTLNSLGLATFIICLNPFAVSDASALLTVTAVLGIVVVKPKIDKLYTTKSKVGEFLQSSVNISLSVLLTTLPVMWLIFGKISMVAVVANIIVVPVTQVALVFTALYVMFSGMPFLAFLPKLIAKLALNIIIFVTEFLCEKLWFLFRNIENEIFGVAICAVLVFMGISLVLFGKISTKITLSFIFAVFVVAGAANVYQQNNNAYVLISPNSMVAAFDKDTCVVVGMNNKSDYYDFLDVSRENNYFIDCEYQDLDYENGHSDSGVISDTFSVTENGNEIILTVCNKNFEIKEDYVIIDNNIFYRNVSDRFSSEDEVILVVSKEG